jgi:hypothetical protein
MLRSAAPQVHAHHRSARATDRLTELMLSFLKKLHDMPKRKRSIRTGLRRWKRATLEPEMCILVDLSHFLNCTIRRKCSYGNRCQTGQYLESWLQHSSEHWSIRLSDKLRRAQHSSSSGGDEPKNGTESGWSVEVRPRRGRVLVIFGRGLGIGAIKDAENSD